MFVESVKPRSDTALSRERSRESLAMLAERTRPTASSGTRLLPVTSPVGELFVDGGLRRGSTIVVVGSAIPGRPDRTVAGEITLALALLARASAAGSWCAAVGLADVGAVATHDLGIDLDRFALIPRPGAAWAEATAMAIDGTDLVVLRPPFSPQAAMVRRLVARARERRSILVVVPGRAGWPERPDVLLTVDAIRWDGIGIGVGYLHRRHMTVTATGRRSAVRPRQCHLWLPSPTGTVESVDTGH
jgi:hypothetical protein